MSRRPLVAAAALALLAAACLPLAAGGPLLAGARATPSAPIEADASLRTRNVILVTLDGLRIQEMFAGMDPIVSEKKDLSGIYDEDRARRLYWRETPDERRRTLLPFFWDRLAAHGIVLGNKEKGSRVMPRNPHLFSAPGYAEILTGQYQPDVTTNDVKRYAHKTVLEFVKDELRLAPREVAMIGGWEPFKMLASSKPDAFFTYAGHERIPREIATPRMAFLDELQNQVMSLWEEGRSDAITFNLALEYLKTQKPRLLYIALGESDDWAHARRYDRLMDYIHVADGYLKTLWETVESDEAYRGQTTLIVTTDHGRGVTGKDWVDHEEGIKGSEDIWVAVIGPDTPDRGEVAPHPTVHQADIAATLLRFFGLDAARFNPKAGPPIEAAFAAGESQEPVRP
ncbi:MAG TPA: AP protein [Candidatus Polarisedimenticolia bacterium]|jgi:hypothetical protein|nr:AP protein [Candidatus Polarisedimenticolia bacterium]